MAGKANPAVPATGAPSRRDNGNRNDYTSARANPWFLQANACLPDELADWEAHLRLILNDPDCAYPETTADLLRLQLDAIETVRRRRREINFRPGPVRYTLSDEFVRRLEDHVDLRELVARDVTLHRSGTSWRGCCPLCASTNPTTLAVWPTRFQCFRCGTWRRDQLGERHARMYRLSRVRACARDLGRHPVPR
jgi:hypothetical protein